MKIKTSELTGAALDWAVAKADGYKGWWAAENAKDGLFIDYPRTQPYAPSTDWAQGGPIIERERIGHQRMEGSATPLFQAWCGTCIEYAVWPPGSAYAEGPTPLIAAMRCFVASKLGDEVDVPEELL